ncbi:hypothetical protein BaRGS_00030919, partial [Batillaria attramentaria]
QSIGGRLEQLDRTSEPQRSVPPARAALKRPALSCVRNRITLEASCSFQDGGVKRRLHLQDCSWGPVPGARRF